MIIDAVSQLFVSCQAWFVALSYEQRQLMADTGIVVCVAGAAMLLLGVQRALRFSGVVLLLGAAYLLNSTKPAVVVVASSPLPPAPSISAPVQATSAVDVAWQSVAAWVWAAPAKSQ